MPEVGLQRSGVVTIVRKLVTTRMSQHVRVSLEGQLGFDVGREQLLRALSRAVSTCRNGLDTLLAHESA
jgi:hypothetical protein